MKSIVILILLISLVLFSGCLGGTSAWDSQVYEGYYFKTISFPDQNNGWVAGSNGVIRHSSDGGKTWNNQSSQTIFNLNSIFFVDANEGWAVGDDGVIRHTTDGGITWGSQNSGGRDFLSQVFFLNKNQGWIVGGDGVGVLLSTSNGGQTWSRTPFGVFLYGVYFVDSQNGWVVGRGGRIWVTTNGGGLWGPQTSGTTRDLRSVYFINKTTGFAAGGSGFITGYDCYYTRGWVPDLICPQVDTPHQTLLKTTDQGQTWSVVFERNGNPLHKVVFRNNTRGWVTAGTEYFVSKWEDNQTIISGGILATQDGGTTWSSQSSLLTGPMYDVWFLDAYNGFAVGGDTGLRWKKDPSKIGGGVYEQKAPMRSWIWHTTSGGW